MCNFSLFCYFNSGKEKKLQLKKGLLSYAAWPSGKEGKLNDSISLVLLLSSKDNGLVEYPSITFIF